MSKGGGGGTGTQKYEWNDALAPYWKDVLSQASTQSKAPLKQYTGQRFAGLDNPDTTAAFNKIRDVTTNGSGPANISREMIANTMSGSYADPWANSMITNGANQYEGESPYYKAALQQGIGDITKAYKDSTAPDTNAAFVMNGTFGGGDWQRQVANNENALGQNLSKYVTGMGNTNYDRSAQLRESALGREQTTDQFNKGMGSASWNAERQRQMGAVGEGLGTEQQAIATANARLGLGDITRQDQQQNLNQNLADWQQQQNYPKDQLAWLTQFLSGAQGGIGPNATTTQTNTTNPYSAVLGSALAGYGMFKAPG